MDRRGCGGDGCPHPDRIVSFQRHDGRGVDVEMRRLVAGVSGRHVEIMRGELATILCQATRNNAHDLFQDSIHTIVEEPDGIRVTFVNRGRSDRLERGLDGAAWCPGEDSYEEARALGTRWLTAAQR